MSETETNAILQELLIEWDDLSSKDYNPIPNAIKLNDPDSQDAVKFRNFYHKLDTEMNKIISNKSQGFNDSIQMYQEIVNLYNKLSISIENTNFEIESIRKNLESIKINELENFEQNIVLKKETFQKLKNLQKTYENFKIFDQELENQNFEFCTQILIEILKEDEEIKAMKDLKYFLKKKRKKLILEMSKKLINFIFEFYESDFFNIQANFDHKNNDFNFRELLSFIVQINGLLEFDQILEENLKSKFFEKINSISKQEKSLKSIFKKMIFFTLKIDQKIYDLCNLINFEDEKSFYGNQFSIFKFFCKNGIKNLRNIFQKIILKFILDYTVKDNLQKINFDHEKLVSNFDSNIFEKKFKLNEIFMKKKNQNFYYDYELVKKVSFRNIFIFNESLIEEIENLEKSLKLEKNVQKEVSMSIKENFKKKSQNKSESINNNDNKNFTEDEKIYDNLESSFFKEDSQKKSQILFLKDLQNLIKFEIDKKMKIEDKNLKKGIFRLFQKKNIFEINLHNQRLFIFNNFLNIFKKYKKRIIFIDNFFWAFEYLEKFFKEKINFFYKSTILKKIIFNKNWLKELKSQILVQKIHLNDLSIKKHEIRQKFLLFINLKEINEFYNSKKNLFKKINKNNKLSLNELEFNYKLAFSLEIFLIILYFLNELIRNIKYSFIELKIYIYELYENINNKDKNLFFFENLSDLINFFILKNVKKINLQNKNDLKLFLENLINFEEILYEIEYFEGIDESIKFFEKILENKSECEEGKFIEKKLNL